MFSLICTRINGWVNIGEAGDLRLNRAHYDVTVMKIGAAYVAMGCLLYIPITVATYRKCTALVSLPLQWCNNGRDNVLNHQPHDCLPNRLFRRRSTKTSKLFVIGFCAGNSPVTDGFPAQMASNAGNIFIWWRHRGVSLCLIVMSTHCSLSYYMWNDLLVNPSHVRRMGLTEMN